LVAISASALVIAASTDVEMTNENVGVLVKEKKGDDEQHKKDRLSASSMEILISKNLFDNYVYNIECFLCSVGQ
jgi:putative ubiquitin-RnfH superfamily antitoxin RatB of RatAB toxin-antitoxin module